MQLEDFLDKLDGVTYVEPNKYMACCPVHEDKVPSMSVTVKDVKGTEKILLKCFAGCRTEDILEELGLTPQDLIVNPTAQQDFAGVGRTAFQPVKEGRGVAAARYSYTDEKGALLAQKTRWEKTVDGKRVKTFTWGHQEGNRWKPGRNGMAVPYRLPGLVKAETVFLCEGEKDVDNLTAQGLAATCSPDGAGTGSKWRDSYTPYFAGKTVYILQDNDDVGKKFAQLEAEKLFPVAKEVKVLDLRELWPELPEKGDISDVMEHMGAAEALAQLLELAERAPGWESLPPEKDGFLSSFHTLAEFAEEEVSWLVEGWLPEGQITLLAADGGTGKTTLWCNLIAALSSGKPCLLDPPGTERTPMRVAFFSTEDSVTKKLKRQLRESGANQDNVITLDFSSGGGTALRELKLGSDRLRELIAYFRPALCVFDPIQGFLPHGMNMGSRNEMRECMAPLIALGEEFGTTFLVVCHTNKRMGAADRSRLADSADLWDVARSVLMMGTTEEPGQRYLSNEKNNYADRQETLLLSFEAGGKLVKTGTTWKRDREFMQEATVRRSAPQREECKAYILQKLEEAGNTLPSKELEQLVKQAGYSGSTLKRAKEELKESSAIQYKNKGNSTNKVWMVQRTEFSEPETYMTLET